jgi:fibronectin-binding autotransporter adhesin
MQEMAKPIGVVATTLLAALMIALTLGAGAASAATCDTSWSGGSGNWTEVGHWSNGLPGGAHPNACITADGTYTVNVTALNGNFNNSIASASNLTLGGASGQQTIAVTGTFTDQSASASLSLAGGTVGPNGRIVFTSNDPNNVAGTSLCAGDTPALVNEGVISFEAGNGGARSIQGTLENKGTINFNGDAEVTSVHSCGTNHLKNAGGTINIAGGKTLTAKEKFTQTAGTTNVNGAMSSPGTDFTVSGGSFTGSSPVLTSPVTFSPSAGSGTFVIHGGTAFGTGIGAGIHVIAEGTASEDALLGFREAANKSTNAGTIQLTSSSAAHSASLFAYENAADSLTNTGTIEVLQGSGGDRILGSWITNAAAGSIEIGADTHSENTSSSLALTNAGTLTVDAGKTFDLRGAPFKQTAGTTAVNGALTASGNSLFSVSGGSFTGNSPVLTGKALALPGGSGTFVYHGFGDMVDDIGAGMTVILEGAGDQARLGVSSAASGTAENKGTIRLTSIAAPGTAELTAYDTTPNSLVNSGTIEVLPGVGGARTLGQAITNTGTVAIEAATTGAFLRMPNSGTIEVAAGKTLSFGEAFTQTAGQLIVDGAFTTNQPINLQGGVLRGTGSVTASTVDNSGATVHPGNSPGVMTIAGNYTQGAGGTLATEIAGSAPGSGYSRLAVSGNVTLGGTLDVTTNGFAPATGQTFQILTGGAREGSFASTAVHGEPGYDVQYGPTDVTLVAHALPQPPPTASSGQAISLPPITTSRPPVTPLKCKKGSKRKKVKSKARCVKVKKHKKKHKR